MDIRHWCTVPGASAGSRANTRSASSRAAVSILRPLSLLFLQLLLFAAVPAGARAQTVSEVAQPTYRPAYVPRLSDVCMRSLSYPTSAIAVAAQFHVTRLDWVYPGDTGWVAKVRAAGLKLQPTLNASLTEVPRVVPAKVGRMLDVNGKAITATWYTWANADPWGCANRREYQNVWLYWAKYYAGLGVDSFQHDDPRMNWAAPFWPPSTNVNNVGPGCFCEDCIYRFHFYIGARTNAWLANYPVNGFANSFLANRGFTVFMVTRSTDNAFGVAMNTANGNGSVPRLYLQRASLSYDTLQTIVATSTVSGLQIACFQHNGTNAAAFYSDGVLQGTATVAVVTNFGSGGHFSLPFQPGSLNSAGDLGELLIFDECLATNDRALIENYLSNRYRGTSLPQALPDTGEPGYYLKLWLRGDDLALADGAPVTRWTPRAGFDLMVPTNTVLPNTQTAAPPVFVAAWTNGCAAVRFDGTNDFLSLSWFNMRDYVLNYVPSQNLRNASASIRTNFEAFQLASVQKFYTNVWADLDRAAGRHIPISCNGSPASEGPPLDIFEFGIREVWETDAHPSYLRSHFTNATAGGKPLMYTMPVSRGWVVVTNWDVDYPALRTRTLKATPTAYALGGLMMVPWDHYMTSNSLRYFGNPADYAHLFKFIRDNRSCLDGYDDAFVAGYELSDTRYTNLQPVELTGATNGLCCTVRAIAGNPYEPVVIHVVEWSDTPAAFTVRINHSRFFATGTPTFRVLFTDRQTDTNVTVVAGSGYTTLTFPALTNWAVIKVEPAPLVESSAGLTRSTPVSAAVGGVLNSVSGQSAHVWLYWGTNSGGRVSADWEHVQDLGWLTPGLLTASLSNLLPAATYQYRFFISNAAFSAWSFTDTPVTTRPADADDDLDGMPDRWEVEELGGMTGAAGDDPDLDQLTNYGEWLSGTDPADRQSVFTADITLSPAGVPTLSWDSQTSRLYTVYRRDGWSGFWTNALATNTRPGSEPVQQWIETGSAARVFYRIGIAPGL